MHQPYSLVVAERIGSPGAPPNLLVEGDCLDAMHALVDDAHYGGQVRLAYLDPPFNTGERSRGYVDAFERRAWTTFMRERIAAAWQLLADDGSLWVHCDDAEQATLRVLLDELCGRAAHVATIVWQRRYSRENRRAFSRAHEYLHVVAPAGTDWKEHRNRLARNDKPGTWRNPDNDPRGPWSTVSFVVQGGHGTPSQFYPIALPSGRTVEPPKGSCWRVTAERFQQLVDEELVWFGPRGDNVPRRKVFADAAKGLVPSTWWTHAEVGHTAEANAEQRRLFHGATPFSTPKPERLMQRMLEIGSDEGDLVLDAFLGSGTTAAVAHKARRRWVGIELDTATVERFAAPRLRAVVEGADRGGTSEAFGWEGGGGFVHAVATPVAAALAS